MLDNLKLSCKLLRLADYVISSSTSSPFLGADSLPELYNKVDLGDGVTIYTVEDSKAGQYAVRKLADSHFGKDFNNWEVISRDRDGGLESSFNTWKNYSVYPKRLAFKNGRLFAFCGSDSDSGINGIEIQWWGKHGDRPFEYIPRHSHLGDDDEFIDKYIYGKGDGFETDISRMTDTDVERALKSPSVSYDFKLRIIQNTDFPWVLSSLAKDDGVSLDILDVLSNNKDWEVRESVANNPNVSTDILSKLSSDREARVRYAVAQNCNDIEVLATLSSDSVDSIRNLVAINPNTPAEVLAKLSNDDNSGVLSNVAKHPNVTARILSYMFDKGVALQDIASNPKTPNSVLVSMLYFPITRYGIHRGAASVAYRNLIKRGYSEVIDVSSDDGIYARMYAARNPNTPADVLETLSEDNDSNVCRFVAQNPNTSIDVLIALSEVNTDFIGEHSKENLRKRGIDV